MGDKRPSLCTHIGRRTLALARGSTAESHSTCGGTGRHHQRFGRHTFRHTYSTLLIANGENVKVVQELMRHASHFTLQIYSRRRPGQRGPHRAGWSRRVCQKKRGIPCPLLLLTMNRRHIRCSKLEQDGARETSCLSY